MTVIKSSTPVLDAAGNPAAGRIVRAYRADNGALLGSVVTSSGAARAYRYWRVYITANVGNTYTAIQGMEYRLTAGGSDYTSPSMTASASSSFAGQSPGQAFDNNYSAIDVGCWVSSDTTVPQWVAIDLGSGNQQAFAEVAIWGQSRSDLVNRSPRDFVIEGSDDGVAWSPVKSFSGVTGWVAGTGKVFDIAQSVLPLGHYEIQTDYTGEVYVVCLDDAAGTTYNHQILRTVPV